MKQKICWLTVSYTHLDVYKRQIIHREPLFIVDGAHNPAAADMLEDSVRKYFKGRKLFFIMGVFRDKDYPYIIRKLCPYAEQIITIETPDNPRALPAVSYTHLDVYKRQPLYREVAQMLFQQREEGQVNPAKLLNSFTDSEEQREVASLFNATTRCV